MNGFGKGTASAVPLPANNNDGFSPEGRALALKTIYETTSSH
jgi:hypothetical protein